MRHAARLVLLLAGLAGASCGGRPQAAAPERDRGAGAATSAGLDQVYARAMPAPPARIGEDDLVRLSQLYARHARVTNERGESYETATWSEIDAAQWQLRQPRARAWSSVPLDRLHGHMLLVAPDEGTRLGRSSS